MRQRWIAILAPLLCLHVAWGYPLRSPRQTPYQRSIWEKDEGVSLGAQPFSVVRERVGDRLRLVINGIPQRIYDDIISGSFSPSPFNRHWTYLARNGQQLYLVTDGRESQPFTAVRALTFVSRLRRTPAVDRIAQVEALDYTGQEDTGDDYRYKHLWFVYYNADGRHHAYVVRDQHGECVVLDGKHGKRYRRIGSLYFSTDGHLAYTAQVGERWRMVLDGQEGRSYGKIRTSETVFSPDSQHLAYLIEEQTYSRVVLDGRELPPFPGMEKESLTFSPDSRRFAYIAHRPDGRATVIADGKPGKAYHDINNVSIHFSPDSQRLAYVARIGESLDIPSNQPDGMRPLGVKQVKYQDVFGAFTVNEAVGINTRWTMVVDGREGKHYPLIVSYGAAFSPDSLHFAYSACLENGRWLPVIDGREGSLYDFAGDFTFSPDGSRVAYGVRVGQKVAVVVDGKRGPLFNGFTRASFRFSPDSERFLYVIQDEYEQRVAVNHQLSRLRYASLLGSAEFSPDSRYVVYAGRRSDGSNPGFPRVSDYVVVDDSERAYPFVFQHFGIDAPMGRAVIFDAPDQFRYFIRRDDNLVYVIQEELR